MVEASEESDMKEFLIEYPPVAATIYALIGLAIFMLAFWLIEKCTPGDLWRNIIEEGNVSAGIIVGASLLGIAAIIAVSIAT